MKAITKIIESCKNASKGLIVAFDRDKSFRMELWGGAVIVFIGYILWPITLTEALFLVLAYILILITELINTAFETALLKLHPERHKIIGASKDIASAAVLASFLFAGVVITALVVTRSL